jgi:hypothetical protein
VIKEQCNVKPHGDSGGVSLGDTLYLTFKNADAAIKFYQRAFGAREILRLKNA